MAGSPQELQYGERSQLQALGQKELPISGGQRPGRSAGRPTTTPQVAGQPGEQSAGGVPPEHIQLMEDYMRAERAVRTADMYAASPTAGPWAKLFASAARLERDKAALKLKTQTPDWDF